MYIAELQIKVDSTQVDQVKQSLDELSKISPKVTSSTDNVSNSFKEATAEAEKFNAAQARLIAKVQEQVNTFGRAKEDVLSYKAGLLGVSNVVDPLVSQLKVMKAEQQAATVAQREQDAANRAIAKSQQQVSTAQHRMVESLKEEIALFGKSKEEVMLYKAGLMGIKDQVEPLIAELIRLKKAKEEEAQAGKVSNTTGKSKRQQELEALAREAEGLERIISLERERIRAENAGNSSSIDSRRTREAEAALTSYQRQLESVNVKQKQLDASADQLGDEYTKLKYSIDPVSKTLDELALKQSRLRELYKSGQLRIPKQEYDQLNSILDANRKRIDDLGKTTGKTAKEINFAMRGLPAQFTDIIISLQGGQAPLTVLLQQGGQIKDMFGGIVPAFKAMGGYVLGLINPLTVMIGTVGALAAIWYDASTDVTQFNKAIYSSKGVVSQTSGELKRIADSAGAASGSISRATSAVIELTKQGNFSSNQVENLAGAISALANLKGSSVEDISQEFRGLSSDVVQATKDISDKFGLITAEQFRAIEAAQKNGDAQKALDILSESLNRAAIDRNNRYIESLSGVEYAWHQIKSAVTGAYNATKNTLFPGLDDQIKDLEERIEKARQPKWYGRNDFDSAFLDNLEKQLAALKSQRDTEKARVEEESRLQALTDERLRITKRISEEEDRAMTQVQKLEKERNELVKQRKRLNEIGSNEDGSVDPAQIARMDSLIANKNEEIRKAQEAATKKQTRADIVRESAAQKMLATLRQQEASLISQRDSMTSQGSEAKKLAKLQQQIADIELKSKTEKLTKEQESILANKEILLAQQKTNAEIEKEIKARDEINRLKGIAIGLDQQLANDRQKYSDALLGAGMGDKAIERLRERNRLEREYQKQLEEAGKRLANEDITKEVYDQETEMYRKSLEDRLAAQAKFFADEDAARSNWLNGAQRSFAKYIESGQNIAGLTEQFFDNTFQSMEDSMVKFVTTGKASFNDLAISILSDLAKIATKIAMTQALSALFGGMMGGGAGAGGASISGYTGDAFSQWLTMQKDGGAWSGGTQFFAKGGAFTNSVVNKPTAFGTGTGLGVMGEAGPEAIMPLTRTSDGQLGVKAAGGGSTIVAPVSVSLSVDSGMGAGGDNNGTEGNGRAAQMAIKAECEKAISNGLKPGGSIWRAMNGR